MEACPENINTEEIKISLIKKVILILFQFSDINKINEFFVWSISGGKTRAVLHILTENHSILDKIKSFLKKKYKIDKVSIEVEFPQDFDE